jgi:hypothetical protein
MNEHRDPIATDVDADSAIKPATWKDIPLFLVGNRHSIQRLIQAKHGLWLGGLFVFSAALSREYDAVSLLHRPWELLGSFAASLILCSGLFLCIQFCLAMTQRKLENHGAYASFLTGYWLTAPMAWLYAVPVEIMADEVTALQFNLTALSIVSLWRVLLFSRVVSVQFHLPYLVSLLWILLPCMLVAFAVLLKAIMPMIAIMGGLRLTQTQEMLREFQSNVLGILYYSMLPVFIAWCATIAFSRIRSETSIPLNERVTRISKSAWSVAITAVFVLLIGASVFQPNLWRSARVDQQLSQGEFESAIALMDAQGEDAFPINWDPPPQFPRGDVSRPNLTEMVETLQNSKPPKWIIDRLLAQADEILLRQSGWYQGSDNLDYVAQFISHEQPETLDQLKATLQTIIALEAGDAEELAHYQGLLQAIEKAPETYEREVADSQPEDPDSEDPDSEDPDSEDPDSEDPDSEDPDSEDPDSEDPDSGETDE